MNGKKNKKHIASKAIIIFLSLIILLNGLGLIVAGVRVKNKKWIRFGIGYMVAELLLSMTGIGTTIATLLYFISIIHTCLICGEYGQLLDQKEPDAEERNMDGKFECTQNSEEQAERKSDGEKNFNSKIQNEDQNKEINFKDLILDIGSANVEGTDCDNMTIQIIDEQGKIYRFFNKGSNIVSFQVGSGKIKNY